MTSARLTPVPLPCAARKDLGILKRRMAFNLYVAPGKMRDRWGIRFSLAHVFNRKEFSAFNCQRPKKGDVPARVHFNEEKLRCRRDRLAAQGLRSRPLALAAWA